MNKLIITVLFSFVVQLIYAQAPLTKDSENSNRIFLKTGIEPSTNISVIYERRTKIKILDNNLVLFVSPTFYNFKLNPKDSEFKIGGVLPYTLKGNLKLVNNLNVSLGNAATKHFNSKKMAIANELTVGVFKQKWFLGLTMEYEKIFLNHIKHTEFYRTTYYEDAVDGWYKGAGGMFQVGLEGGLNFSNGLDVVVELKRPWTNRLNPYNGSPFHVNLGAGYRF